LPTRPKHLSRGDQDIDAEVDTVNLTRHDFHRDWNYTISPKLLALEQ
jgi:hypothetical protein